MIIFEKGNLFDEIDNVEAVVNTVNLVGVMGKGIALSFKNKYPENNKIYKKKCETKEIDIGKSFVYEVQNSKKTKYIINLPTKNHYRNPSRMSYIEKGLDNLIEILQHYKISSIAMPALGCGNGKLNWNEVKPLIIQKLSGIEDVKIIVFEPSISSDFSEKNEKTKKKAKPRLTKDRKKLLLTLNDYNHASTESLATFIQFHTLCYLLNYNNKNMKFELTSNGPFFSDINKLILLLSEFYIMPVNTNEIDSPKQIKVLNTNFPARKEIEQDSEYLRVKKLIEGFETRQSLLILAISHWFKFNNNVTSEELKITVDNWLLENNYSPDRIKVERAINRIEKIYTNSENLSFDLF